MRNYSTSQKSCGVGEGLGGHAEEVLEKFWVMSSMMLYSLMNAQCSFVGASAVLSRYLQGTSAVPLLRVRSGNAWVVPLSYSSTLFTFFYLYCTSCCVRITRFFLICTCFLCTCLCVV